MPDFWRSSGYRLALIDAAGRLAASDDFLRASSLRPELVPLQESCAAEAALHEALLESPRLAVPEARLAALADADARDNYRALLAFRDRLVAAPTLEAAWLNLLRRGTAGIPPLFLDQLVHVILRHLLRDCADPLRLRAAELLFREQKVTLQDGRVMLADDETVEMQAARARPHLACRPARRAGAAPRSIDLDVLDEASAAGYWSRSDRFDTVLDLGFARPGPDALCRVLEAWVAHFTLRNCRSSRCSRSPTSAGSGTSASTSRRARCSTTSTRAGRSRRAPRPAAGAVPPGVSRSRTTCCQGCAGGRSISGLP